VSSRSNVRRVNFFCFLVDISVSVVVVDGSSVEEDLSDDEDVRCDEINSLLYLFR